LRCKAKPGGKHPEMVGNKEIENQGQNKKLKAKSEQVQKLLMWAGPKGKRQSANSRKKIDEKKRGVVC